MTTTEIAAALASGSLRILDLTNTLSSDTPTLRLPAPFANLIDFSMEEVSRYNEPGPFWMHQNIHTGEHIGTHIDAPVHWISGRDGVDVASIVPERLIGPAVVLDFTAQVAANPDYLVTIEDIQAWEAEHGVLPDNAWVLFRTGWDRFSDDQEAFLNADDTGSHTPGMTAEAAKWLAEETNISGVGVETVGIDAGRGAELDPPFPAHYHLLGNDKYGITSLQNLAQLPPTGAVIVVAPLPIIGAGGSPSRVFALIDG
ncbi:cyclase family protein [Leucobacter luti]|uniref:Kynurenine formamidase n=1 Tax=Leucobacter luti TaxID=340320 RepID=A0A4R6S7A7_9MICO|nr:cyclase family protein [Leucobacter luti]MCW2288680.1 kynurenine formamidase [Leucobacter luti]QYM75398.1 cyclase family protein [Leucobacter luti]TCK45165.1 kynurenine formamidase [Leucobacter luti]TDP95690.1 kynurenine formamidase [Leucobacter luti]